MSLRASDLETLSRMREKFLTPHPGGLSDYWDSEGTLDAYDRTFARRIGWKWEAVVRALKGALTTARLIGEDASGDELHSTFVPLRRVVDWGCGTGVASVAVANGTLEGFLAPDAIFHPYDRSLRAMDFAARRLREGIEETRVVPVPNAGTLVQRDTLLLVSHVLTELPQPAREELQSLALRAGAVVWVEPGTPFCSSLLVETREVLRSQGFVPLAPCPHASRCPMVGEDPERNWCHFFAEPPAEVFRDGEWAKLSRALGIDLRALPVSYVALARGLAKPESQGALLLGRPRHFKGHSRWVQCQAGAIMDCDFQHKSDRELARSLDKPLFHRFVARR